VSVLDYATQSLRTSRLVDLYDAARLADQLGHIHNYGQPFIVTELSNEVLVHDINAAYAALAGRRRSIYLQVGDTVR
jgi:trimethylamine---corrinoid protein Co-methyltransferase